MSSVRLTNSDTHTSSPAKPARNSSVELLRILAMCGVVILHYNNKSIGGGLGYATGAGYVALFILESIFICAVNLYILISGYFMCTSQKRSLSKPFALLVQVCIFGAGIYILRCLVSGGWSLKSLLSSMVPNNYFVMLYVAVSAIGIYLVCWVAFWIWELVTKPLFGFAEKRLAKLDHLFSITESEEN